MLDLSSYRIAFAPLLAVLIIGAFSLESVPPPLEPRPVTAAFDAERALADARAIARRHPDRPPGSADNHAVAELVAERFSQIAAGELVEARFRAEADGEERELRNVVLTLPGASERAVLVLAARDSVNPQGAASSAAATAVLVELAAALGVTERPRTIVFASTDGAWAGAAGARALPQAIAERHPVDAAVVISQPGVAEPVAPHVVASSAGERAASLQVVETAAAALVAQASLEPQREGLGPQIARLALPSGLGEQAVLIARGIDAVAISGAGELPLAAGADTLEALSVDSLDRFGRTALVTVNALAAARAAPRHGPQSYLRLDGSLIPGWTVSLLVLALLLPAAAVVLPPLLRQAREGRATLGWALAWIAPGAAVVIAIRFLALVGLVPDPDFPFDPGGLRIGIGEAIALLALGAVALAAARAAGLRQPPAGASRPALAAAAGSLVLAACLALWLANPFLALLCVPLAHVAALHGVRGAVPAWLVAAAAAAAALPLLAAAAYVGGELEWGASAPWQLVAICASGQLPLVVALALAALAGGAGGCIAAAREDDRPSGADGRAGSRAQLRASP